MANQLVASSSLPPSWRYHVFLSFRGEDTRTNFTDHLYNALVLKEIKTFIDRDLTKGEEISPTLLKAIEESRISLVILSKKYANSRWCLEELVKIHQCRESEQQIIVPVFYKVDPSHVRSQTGCYGAAFIGHERKFKDKEMVIRWREALTKVGNLSGFHVQEQDSEVTKINDIVDYILKQLRVLDEIKQKILALRSNNNNKKYLRFIRERIENFDGLVQFSEEDVKSEFAKFQMEPAGEGLVHIKCCFNKKYLRRANEHRYWIVAKADKPVEDKSHWSCTLFKPMVVHSDEKAVYRLLHVQLEHFVRSFTVNGFNQCLFARSDTPDLHNDMDVYTVVDLEPLVLPSHFVLKSNNNNRFLHCMPDQENNIHQILQFYAHDRKSEFAQFHVERANGREHQNNHYVHIKCLYNNKYLRRMENYNQRIHAAADNRDENTESWTCTLFKPESVGLTGNNDNNVLCRLRHVATGLYTKPFVENRFELLLGEKNPDPQEVDVYTAIRTHT